MELSQQVEYARSELCYRGSILYGYAALKNDSQGLFGEVQDVFSDEIVYTDVESSGSGFAVSIPYSGSYVDGAGTFVIGTSDPSEPLLARRREAEPDQERVFLGISAARVGRE